MEKTKRKKEMKKIRRIRDDEDEGRCWVNLMNNIKIEITRTPLDSTPFKNVIHYYYYHHWVPHNHKNKHMVHTNLLLLSEYCMIVMQLLFGVTQK